MKLMDIVSAIASKVASSSSISAWCTTNRFSPLKIFVGLNGKNPPTEKDCPYVIIYPSLWTEGEREGEWSWIVVVAWSVYNSGSTTSGNTVALAGLQQTDELGELLWSCVKDACLGLGFPASRSDYDIEAYEFFPQFPGRMSVVIRVPKVLV